MSTRNTRILLRLLLLLLVGVMLEAGARVGQAQEDVRLLLCEYRYTTNLQNCAPNDEACRDYALGQYTLCLLNIGPGGGGGSGGGVEFCAQAKWRFDQCWGEYQICGGFFGEGCWDTYYSCWQASGIDQCQ